MEDIKVENLAKILGINTEESEADKIKKEFEKLKELNDKIQKED